MTTAKLAVNEVKLETKDVSGSCDEIINYNIRVFEEGSYKSGLKVNVVCNGKDYELITDSNGYATLKIHLKAGTYSISIKYNSIVKNNKITVNKKYVSNKYKNVNLKTSNAYFKQNKKISYSFEGNLNGYLKIYKGNSVKYSKKINTNGYISDYFTYKKHSFTYSIKNIKGTGIFTAKIVTSSGKVLSQSKFKIRKAPTKIECDSFKKQVGSKDYVWAYVSGDEWRDVDYGIAKFNINGKIYKTKVKNGMAQVKVKFPSKVKTLKCKVKFLSNKYYKSSSTKFKISVKKASSKIYVDPVLTKTSKKITIKAYVAEYLYETNKMKKGIVKFKIAGKTYKAKVKNGIAKVTIKAPSNAKKYSCKAIFVGNKKIKSSSHVFKMTVKKKVSKYKVISTKAKSYWVTKRSGQFKVSTKIWDMTAGFMAPYKYIDTTLYKNGKQVYPSKYSVKYKINGRWTGWSKYGITSTAHHRYSVPDSAIVGQIKVKVNRNVNSFI